MELNTKGRYAVMAMADLARHDSPTAVPLTQVAERQRLPLAYLEQLFVHLRRANLVDSARGRSGGYRLAKPARDISVAAVMAAVEEETRFTRCAGEGPGCVADQPCLTHDLWTALSHSTASFLQSVSLADVVDGKLARRDDGKASGVRLTAKAARSYLDYNATAPLRAEAKVAMLSALDCDGNPSSVHAEGRRARAIVETAREQVAALAGSKPTEVFFTSGATEANAWALGQTYDNIFMSAIEHDSVLVNVTLGKANVIDIPAGSDGVACIEAVAEHVMSGKPLGRALVTLQMANNETGAVQPVAELAEFAREHGLRFHTDAVQAAGRLVINFRDLDVDTMALSAHKMGGPKGIGALIIRDGFELVPLIRGGGQERRRRAGTENVSAIAGFGAAAQVALADLQSVAKIAALRDKLEAAVREIAPDSIVISAHAPRLANTSLIALKGRSAENLVIKFDLAGIAVSAGSACSSGKVGQSHVLRAMGLDPEIAGCAVRLSLGPETTDKDIAAFLAAFTTIAKQPALAA